MKLWSSWYQTSDYARQTNQQVHVERSKDVVKRFGPLMKDVNSFCELGVGSGRNIHFFREKYPQWLYFSNDINPTIIEQIDSIYPGLADKDNVNVEIIDTLSYLKKLDEMDVFFTHGHLMHLPHDVINEVCSLIAKKSRKHILIMEAGKSSRKVSWFKRWKYRKYRFERDYSDMFPGWALKKKEAVDDKSTLYFFEPQK